MDRMSVRELRSIAMMMMMMMMTIILALWIFQRNHTLQVRLELLGRFNIITHYYREKENQQQQNGLYLSQIQKPWAKGLGCYKITGT